MKMLQLLGLPIGGKPNSDASLGRIVQGAKGHGDTRPQTGPERRAEGVLRLPGAYPHIWVSFAGAGGR